MKEQSDVYLQDSSQKLDSTIFLLYILFLQKPVSFSSLKLASVGLYTYFYMNSQS